MDGSQKYYGKGQNQKITYCMSPFTWHFRKGKTIRMKNRPVFARDCGEGSAYKKKMGTGWQDCFISCLRSQDCKIIYIYLLTCIEQYSLKWGILLGANYTSINRILKKRNSCLPSYSTLPFIFGSIQILSLSPPTSRLQEDTGDKAAECRKKGWLPTTSWGKTILAALRF